MIQIVTQPAVEPVSGADVRKFLRMDSTDYTEDLARMATSARIMAENYTRRAFITQSWMLSVDIDKVLDEITIPRPHCSLSQGLTFMAQWTR